MGVPRLGFGVPRRKFPRGVGNDGAPHRKFLWGGGGGVCCRKEDCVSGIFVAMKAAESIGSFHNVLGDFPGL
jgi:hypothetical protein